LFGHADNRSSSRTGNPSLLQYIPGHTSITPTTVPCPSPSGDTFRYFSCIVKHSPSDKYGWNNLGVVAQSDKDLAAAVSDYEKAIAIDPRFEAPLYDLGVLRLQTGDYRAAITLLTRAVALNPKDANAHWKLGLALTHLHTAAGNARATVELNKALKLDPALLPKGSPPLPPACPAHQNAPTFNETFCGPTPPPGDGFGPSGECTGRETAPPCGPGMIPNRYYAYTLPGRCDGRLILDGGHWRSELPPQMPVPDMYVWVSISTDGRTAGFISPNGSVGIEPDTGQPPSVCTTNTPPTPSKQGPVASPATGLRGNLYGERSARSHRLTITRQ
jgi:hypothetical protein